MNRHAALLPLAVFIALAAVLASASTPTPALLGAKTPQSAPPSLKPVPADAKSNHLITVKDEKGLLLTCIAPEIETNVDTDLFNSCALAPGRSLDDVMHTFVQGIHYEQSQHQKERDQWLKYLEDSAARKPAEKP